MNKSGNPAFSSSALERIETSTKSVMSARGTYAKTFFLLILVIVSAGASWSWMEQAIVDSTIRWWPLWLASLFTFFLGMVISFNPKSARTLAPVYALLQGAFLGIVSGTFENSFDGIVGQAVFTTLSVFLAVYVGYSLGILKATSTFVRIIITAMMGILMYSLLSWFFALFGFGTPITISTSPWGIAFSVLVVLVAALSLVIDFDFIDRAEKEKFPKYFEWYGAFGLMVGLIWLYMEILRLLAKIAATRN